MSSNVYYYVLIPLFVVGGLVYTLWAAKRAKQRALGLGLGRVLTETYRWFFRLEPGEELVRFWAGQVYDGPMIAEYKDRAVDKVGRALGGLLLNTSYHTARVWVGLTTHGRVVVSVENDEFHPKPYREFEPGAPIYFAADFPGQEPGKAPSNVGTNFISSKNGPQPIAKPAIPVPGQQGGVAFVLFGREQGSRLPAWIAGDIADVIMRWRRDPVTTTADLAVAAAPPAPQGTPVAGKQSQAQAGKAVAS